MIQFFKHIILGGFKTPRNYLLSLNMTWRQIFKVSLLSTLMLMIGMSYSYYQPLKLIQEETNEAMELMPDFQVSQQELTFDNQGKPYYYSGEFVQMIIDDEISPSPDGQLILPTEKKQLIMPNRLINLYLLNDRTYAKVGDTVYNITNLFGSDFTSEDVRSYLTLLGQPSGLMILLFAVSLFIVQIPIYWLLIIVTTLMTGLLNIFLAKGLSFSLRFRLVVVASIVPIALTQLFQAFLPFNFLSYHLIILGTLIIVVMSYRDQSAHLQKMFQIMGPNLLDKLLGEEDESDKDDDQDDQ